MKTKRSQLTNKNKTKKVKLQILPNKTPKPIYELSVKIQNQILKKKEDVVSSYAPTVNQQLVSLVSVKREPLLNCNSDLAFKLMEPLKYGINIKSKTIKCLPIDNSEVIVNQLKALKANKHINVSKIVPPVQHMSNCWFNTMFMSFFVSDKGRKFFHFFRQLMIEGKQYNGAKIPKTLHNAFSLLNYAIESTLTGSEFAYKMDTNAIIKKIYEAIPTQFKRSHPFITDINLANNPLRYYLSLIEYLGNSPLLVGVHKLESDNWTKGLMWKMGKVEPHIIILEVFDAKDKKSGDSGKVTNKLKKFKLNGHKYVLDSCIIRDTNQQHFCCTLTAEGKEYAYDGNSYKKLVPMNWKNKINNNSEWQFEGTYGKNGKPLKWNFLHGYQMLVYYRYN